MTLTDFRHLIRANGPKGTLRITLSNPGSELLLRGQWSLNAQLDLFRDRVLFMTSWTEVWVDISDLKTVEIDGGRISATMQTNSIAWIPQT